MVGLLVLAGMFLMMQSQPKRSGFIKKVPFLANLNSYHETSYLIQHEAPGGRVVAGKGYTTVLVTVKKPAEAAKMLEPELSAVGQLSSRTIHGTHRYTLNNVAGQPGYIHVDIGMHQSEGTFISIAEVQQPNLVDRARLWFEGVRGNLRGGTIVLSDRVR